MIHALRSKHGKIGNFALECLQQLKSETRSFLTKERVSKISCEVCTQSCAYRLAEVSLCCKHFGEKMLNPCNAFARITEQHDLLALKLTPCAGLLHRFLLRSMPAGKPQEFELKEFCAWADYSLKWARSSLKELCDLELVEVIRTFSRQGYKLIAYHPDRQETSPISKETSTSRQKTSQKTPSKPYSVYPSYRGDKEFKETTNKTATHPVTKRQQGELISSSISLKTPEPEIELEIEPTILQNLETAGFKMNSTLNTIVRSTQSQTVLQAIEAAQQYLSKLEQKKQPLRRQPEALLVSAIREEWQPQRQESVTNVVPPEFNEWFNLAKTIGLAKASSIQADVTGLAAGILCVLTDSGWATFDEMLNLFGLPEMKDMSARL
jgi:hypothetical protein